jgi:hypothetical protein
MKWESSVIASGPDSSEQALAGSVSPDMHETVVGLG